MKGHKHGGLKLQNVFIDTMNPKSYFVIIWKSIQIWIQIDQSMKSKQSWKTIQPIASNQNSFKVSLSFQVCFITKSITNSFITFKP